MVTVKRKHTIYYVTGFRGTGHNERAVCQAAVRTKAKRDAYKRKYKKLGLRTIVQKYYRGGKMMITVRPGRLGVTGATSENTCKVTNLKKGQPPLKQLFF